MSMIPLSKSDAGPNVARRAFLVNPGIIPLTCVCLRGFLLVALWCNG